MNRRRRSPGSPSRCRSADRGPDHEGATVDTLIDLVRIGGERFDSRPALIIRPPFRTRITTYRDLATSVPRAAQVMADAGLGVGDRVILWAVNRPEWGLAFL